MALSESAARCPASDDLTRQMMGLRGWALYFLNALADSAAQAIVIGEQLITEQKTILGPDHPSTLASGNSLAIAYRAVGRTSEAITLGEQTLAARERVLGPDHPSTLASGNSLAAAYQAAGRTSEQNSNNVKPANI
jgi:Tetratricopeptide repeat